MSTEEIKALLEERALGQKGQIHFSMADCSTVEKDVNAYHVVCNNCKACGPRELTPAEAIVSWNKAE